MFLLCAGRQHPVDIAREHVTLHIELSSDCDLPKRRLLSCVGNDVDRETGRIVHVSDGIDGQRHAIERNRALRRDHRSDLARHANLDSRRIAFGVDGSHLADRVHVAGDDMPAELVAEPKRSLEVELRAFSPVVGRGTYLADQPRLDVRLPGLEERSPRRALLTRGDAVDGWETLRNPQDVSRLHDVNDLLVEGGSATATAFLTEDLVDRMLIYRAPVIVGEGKSSFGYVGLDAIADAHGRWRFVGERKLGVDRLEVYERVRES